MDAVVLPGDGSGVDATSSTELFGWQCTACNAARCASFGDPFAGKPVFTGTLDSNTGGGPDIFADADTVESLNTSDGVPADSVPDGATSRVLPAMSRPPVRRSCSSGTGT